ncbi:MAG: hypothetical protein ABIH03_13225 [Pseudomonadota bacterium]
MKLSVILGFSLIMVSASFAQTADTEHSSAKEHRMYCEKKRTTCVDTYKWYRQHELTHCRIQYNQCMQVWKKD